MIPQVKIIFANMFFGRLREMNANREKHSPNAGLRRNMNSD